MHCEPNFSAALTPDHGTTGSGAFHRRGPTGGAANGMPLNTRTPSAVVPRTLPPSIVVVSDAARPSSDAATINIAAPSTRFIKPPWLRRKPSALTLGRKPSALQDGTR